MMRVPGAAQHAAPERGVMRCRPGTVPAWDGPGSAAHRSTSFRAAPRPRHGVYPAGCRLLPLLRGLGGGRIEVGHAQAGEIGQAEMQELGVLLRGEGDG